MRRAALFVALLGLAAPAGAQTFVSVFSGPLSGNLISTTSVDVSVSGSLVVTFRGDQAAGCAARGLCGYSGVVVWRPSSNFPTGALAISKLRQHRRIGYSASFAVYGRGPGGGTASYSQVRREVAGQPFGICGDAASSSGSYADLPVHAGRITFRLLGAGSSLLATRCAGPLDADIARFLPPADLSLRAALRGHVNIDLSGTRNFAVGGFAGSVRSTLVLHLRDTYTDTGNGGSSRPERDRVVTEPITLLRATGAITARVHGVANQDVCLPLDSCGLQESFSVQPRPPMSRGALVAYGPAKRPYRDFLAALGLSRRGRSAGIFVYGAVGWDRGGAVVAESTQSGGCRDSAPLGTGEIVFETGRTGVLLAGGNGVSPSGGNGLTSYYSAAGSLHARCPGPQLAGAVPYLAEGTTTPHALAGRQFSVSLRPDQSFSDDGYEGRLGGSLTLTLRRGRLTQHVISR